MKTAVVVLNWNTKDYLRSFLPGLIGSCSQAEAEVVVADSGSTDGSVDVLREEFPEVRTVLLDKNYGFTGGYNRALAGLEADYYVLINSDIEVGDGWLGPLVRWMDSHPECGICGPKLHGLLNQDGKYVRSSRFEYAGAAGGVLDRFGYPYCRGRIRQRVSEDKGQYDNADPDVLWVTGACLMIRRSLWERLGGFDKRFFAHMEEIDLCWRAQLMGWKVNVVPQSVVWHLGGGTLAPASPFKLKLNFRNNLLLLDNNLEQSYISQGLSPSKAAKKSSLFLRFRVVLDFCAGIVYFCTGKPEYTKAVRDARREWRELRMLPHPKVEAVQGAVVSGLTRKCIVINQKMI